MIARISKFEALTPSGLRAARLRKFGNRRVIFFAASYGICRFEVVRFVIRECALPGFGWLDDQFSDSAVMLSDFAIWRAEIWDLHAPPRPDLGFG